MAASSAVGGAGSAGALESDSSGPTTRYCTRHPNRETLISCGRCGRPFCTECLIHTAAGLRCYECAGVRRDAYQRAVVWQVARAFGTIVLGAAISSVAGFFAFIIGAFAGGVAGQALAGLVTRRTRGFVYLTALVVVLAGAILGFAVAFLLQAIAAGALARFGVANILIGGALRAIGNLGFWLFTVVAGVMVYQRVR